jgi:transposase
VTLQLLWEEYRQSQPEGYRYSQFCELYRRWRRKQDVVLRQEHRAGEKMFGERSSPQHENLRGGHYYESPSKRVQ